MTTSLPIAHNPKSPRLAELDFLRGVAILLVLGHHLALTQAGYLQPVFDFLYRFGWTGVDLFFVLSGFLVGGLLFQEIKQKDHLNVRRFIIRRGFKIWPSYYVYLGVSALVLLGSDHLSLLRALKILLPNLLHVQNYCGPVGSPGGTPMPSLHIVLIHTWSLAVEEHFYLLLPLLLAFMLQRWPGQLKQFPRIVLFTSAVCLILRCAPPHWSYPYAPGMYLTHLRIDSLFFGVLIAYLYHLRPEVFARLSARQTPLLFAGFLLLSPVIALGGSSRFTQTVGCTLLYCGYGCLLIAIISPQAAPLSKWFFRTLAARGVAYIGLFSYSIYLWHLMLMGHVFTLFTKHHWLAAHSELRAIAITLVFVFLSVGTGILFYKLIERPSLIAREKLFPAVSR